MQFFLLVQPEFMEKAMSSVERIDEDTATPLENFALIEGDITAEDLGIAADDLESIRDETTDVFHLAAVDDLAVEKEIANRVNLEGTGTSTNSARPSASAALQLRLDLLRRREAEGRILETDLEHDAGFRNYYEETNISPKRRSKL